MTGDKDIGPADGAAFRMIEKLREQRDRLETVLESMRDGMFTVDGMGRLRMFNSQASRMLGLDEADLKRPLDESIPFAPLLALVGSADEEQGSVEFALPGAPSRTVLARRSPLQDPGGVLVVLSDVTEMRRLETIRRDFVANVSHELRTPISVIQANAETLLDGAMDDPGIARGFVGAMLRNAERLSNIISDLLDLSRIEARRFPVKIERVALAPVVARMLDPLALKMADHELRMQVTVPEGIEVMADASAVEQVLQNLLDNAAKYTPDHGSIRVAAGAVDDDSGMVRLTVSNDGPPIAARHQARIFERFYRIDAGRSRDMGGTGLGLAIVKHLVETMHGEVGVESSEGRDTTFWVHLPAA